MTEFDFTDHSHKRYNPLSDSWVLCSPHRAKRPWLGQQEKSTIVNTTDYDPTCYLWNNRIGGEANPDYKGTYVFGNDFPAVKQVQPEFDPKALKTNSLVQDKVDRLFHVEGVRGVAKVICFSPNHNLTMAAMTEQEIGCIIQEWINQTKELRNVSFVNYVQFFENKGATMGCSNPHPHGQIWATEDIPLEPRRELDSLAKYKEKHHSCLLCDLVDVEVNLKDRMVVENDSWICIVPFWAIWPFETIVLPRRHISAMDSLDKSQQNDLASILRIITCKYDNLFETSFPYSMGIHGSPNHDDIKNHLMHLHLHFYPPLLRSATVKKFLVGFEMLGEPQRDLTAEQAATRLRELSDTHYTLKI